MAECGKGAIAEIAHARVGEIKTKSLSDHSLGAGAVRKYLVEAQHVHKVEGGKGGLGKAWVSGIWRGTSSTESAARSNKLGGEVWKKRHIRQRGAAPKYQAGSQFGKKRSNGEKGKPAWGGDGGELHLPR